MEGEYPVEPKVKAASFASAAAMLILTLVANLLANQDNALLLGTLPEWAEVLLLPLVPALAALVAGYQAQHQYRQGTPANGST